jgi:hypothetical protein
MFLREICFPSYSLPQKCYGKIKDAECSCFHGVMGAIISMNLLQFLPAGFVFI